MNQLNFPVAHWLAFFASEAFTFAPLHGNLRTQIRSYLLDILDANPLRRL